MLVKQVLAVVNLGDQKVFAPAAALGGNKATLSTLLNPLIINILIVSGIVAFGTILIAGFSFIAASGDKAKTAQASQALTYGIIGLVVVAAAFLITRLMSSILGFNFL